MRALARSIFLLVGLASLALASHASTPSLYDNAMQWQHDSGQYLTLANWRGKPALITMAYSNCRKICSATLRKLEELQAEMDQQQRRIEIIVVSYDPKNDTPAAWSAYRHKHGLSRSNWHFLSGSESDTHQLSRLLGLGNYWSLEGHIMHDFAISLLNPDGNIVKQIQWHELKVSNLLGANAGQ